MSRWIALAAWGGFLFCYGLSGPLYRTEALRAIIGQSALDGHWLVPTLYGEPFLTKPPGTYAAIGACSLPFGRVTETSARIPSALAATITLLFAYGTFRRFLGDRRAFVIALLLPVSMLWLDKAPSAEIDMLQLAWVSAALFQFLLGYEAKESGRTAYGWWAGALACVAGGFLTKWTAPAFFYLTVGPFLLCRGRWRWLFAKEHLLGALVAFGLCAAWALSVAHSVGWEILVDTVGREAAQRFAPKANGKPYPWVESLTFEFVVLAACLPWSLGLVSREALAERVRGFRGIRSNSPDDSERGLRGIHSNSGENSGLASGNFGTRSASASRLTLFLHCWIWPNLIFWSLPAQHNVRYVLPLCPAIAALGIIGAMRWFERTSPRFNLRLVATILVLWAGTKIVFVEAIVPARTADRNAEATGQELARLVPHGELLYLCKLKDEGVLFYFGRPARRFTPTNRPNEPYFALLIESEWAERQSLGSVSLIATLVDQQKAPLYLVRVSSGDDDQCLDPPYHPIRPSSPSVP